jgi:hypothetical protein
MIHYIITFGIGSHQHSPVHFQHPKTRILVTFRVHTVGATIYGHRRFQIFFYNIIQFSKIFLHTMYEIFRQYFGRNDPGLNFFNDFSSKVMKTINQYKECKNLGIHLSALVFSLDSITFLNCLLFDCLVDSIFCPLSW